MTETVAPEPKSAPLNPWAFVSIALAVALVVMLAGNITGAFLFADADTAAKRAIGFINNNMLQGQAIAQLINVTERSGLYLIAFEVDGQLFTAYITKDGNLLLPTAIDLTAPEAPQPEQPENTTIGNFIISQDEICRQDGKPIVYLFGSSRCPACTWLKPILANVTAQFGDNVVFRDNIDRDADGEVYQRYGTGYIPLTVLGCRYYRTGIANQDDAVTEAREITALLCKLTDGKPEAVCAAVQDLITV